MNRIALILFRIILILLIWFELLNWVGILHFSLVYTWQWLMIVAIFVWIITEIVLSYKKNINVPLILALISALLLLDAFWDMFHLYSTIRHYDKFLHFFNSGVVTYLIFIVLGDILRNARLGNMLSAIILISIGSLFWTLYEIEEFLEDVLINKRQIRLWDGYDTAWDLLMNVIWCVAVVLILLVVIKDKKRTK